MSEALHGWSTHSMFPSRSHRKPVDWLPIARRAGRVASGVLGAVGFAAIMWLLLAGPGFVSGSAGHAPAPKVARR